MRNWKKVVSLLLVVVMVVGMLPTVAMATDTGTGADDTTEGVKGSGSKGNSWDMSGDCGYMGRATLIAVNVGGKEWRTAQTASSIPDMSVPSPSERADHFNNIIMNWASGTVNKNLVRTAHVDYHPVGATGSGKYYSFGKSAVDFMGSGNFDKVGGELYSAVKSGSMQLKSWPSQGGPLHNRTYNTNGNVGGYENNIVSWMSYNNSSEYYTAKLDNSTDKKFGYTGSFDSPLTYSPIGGINGAGEGGNFGSVQCSLIYSLMTQLYPDDIHTNEEAVKRFIKGHEEGGSYWEYRIIFEPMRSIKANISRNKLYSKLGATPIMLTYREYLALASVDGVSPSLSGYGNNKEKKLWGTVGSCGATPFKNLSTSMYASGSGFHAANLLNNPVTNRQDIESGSYAIGGVHLFGNGQSHSEGIERGDAAKLMRNTNGCMEYGCSVYEPFHALLSSAASGFKLTVTKEWDSKVQLSDMPLVSDEEGYTPHNDVNVSGWPFVVSFRRDVNPGEAANSGSLYEEKVGVRVGNGTALTLEYRATDHHVYLNGVDQGTWNDEQIKAGGYTVWVRECSAKDGNKWDNDMAMYFGDMAESDKRLLKTLSLASSFENTIVSPANYFGDDKSESGQYFRNLSFTQATAGEAGVVFRNKLRGFSVAKTLENDDRSALRNHFGNTTPWPVYASFNVDESLGGAIVDFGSEVDNGHMHYIVASTDGDGVYKNVVDVGDVISIAPEKSDEYVTHKDVGLAATPPSTSEFTKYPVIWDGQGFWFLPCQNQRVYLFAEKDTGYALFDSCRGVNLTEAGRSVQADGNVFDSLELFFLGYYDGLFSPEEIHDMAKCLYVTKDMDSVGEDDPSYKEESVYTAIFSWDTNGYHTDRHFVKDWNNEWCDIGSVPDENVDISYRADHALVRALNTGLEVYGWENIPKNNVVDMVQNVVVGNKWYPMKHTVQPAHLIVDYNFPGVGASDDTHTNITNVDCGMHAVGDTVSFGLAGNFGGVSKVLTKGMTEPVLVETMTGENATGTITVKFDGLWTEPVGGDPVAYGPDGTGANTWQHLLTKSGLTVLYAHWVVEKELTGTGGGGGGTVTLPDKGHLYTVYYDQGYDGGGITSALWGKFHVPIAMKAAKQVPIIRYGEGGAYVAGYNWEWYTANPGGSPAFDNVSNLFQNNGSGGVTTGQWDISNTYEITVEFSHPDNPIRTGFRFVGWTDSKGLSAFGSNFMTGFTYDDLSANGKYTVFAKGKAALVDTNYAVSVAKLAEINKAGAVSRLMFASDGLTPQITDAAAKELGDSCTYYAVWMALPVVWDANGGRWDNYSGDGGKDKCFKGDYRWYVWPGEVDPYGFVDIVGGNGSAPLREGYEFDQWYYNPRCEVPLTEMVMGVQPNRDYYAGWIPQPVYVNYYDTREGTSLITTQEYEYDDLLMLLDTVRDTSGEHFVSWKDKSGKTVSTGLLLDKVVLTPHESSKGDIQVDYQTYWTLDLYADYDHQTASYTVTLDWDDYDNNDGVRPTQVTVGLIDSRGNAVIDSKAMTGSATAQSWTTRFDGLDITTSDASTEKVTYSFCLLDYTDVNGNKYTVGDTGATSGELQVQTKSGVGSTDAVTSYNYALNRYSSGNGNGAYNAYTGHIYMNHNLILTGEDIKFTIQWDDDSNRDGVRPQAVTLALYDESGNLVVRNDDANLTGNAGMQSVSEAMCDVSSDGNTWTYTFKDYQKYTNGGKLAGYSIGVESDVNGYTVSYLDGGSQSDENGVVLKYVLKTVSPRTVVRWDDESDRDGTRPDAVVLKLSAYQYNEATGTWETVEVDTKTVANVSGDIQTVEWGSHPKFSGGGNEIIYQAEVVSDLDTNVKSDPSDKSVTNNGYTWAAGTESKILSNVLIHHDINRVDVLATVEWDDMSDQDKSRPHSIVLHVSSADGSEALAVDDVVVFGDGDTWTHLFEDLPMNVAGKHGQRAAYRIQAVESTGGSLGNYQANYLTLSGEHTVQLDRSGRPYVRLSYQPLVVDPTVTITWDDESDRDGTRVDSVDVKLSAYQWNNATYRWETVDVDVATIAGGNDADAWSYTWEGLPKYHDGYEIIYKTEITSDLDAKVKSDPSDKSVTNNGYTWTSETTSNTVSSITVHHDINRVDVLATVEWDDGRNQDALRPEAVRFKLFHVLDGEMSYLTGDVDVPVVSGGMADDTWTYVFENMPMNEKGKHGERIAYGLEVAEIMEGDLYGDYIDTPNGEQQRIVRYVASYIGADGQASGDMASSVQPYVRLTHGRNTGTIYVYASWHDQENRDGKRPTTLLIDLYKQVDGERTYLKTINLAAGRDNAWTYVEKGLPTSEDGKPVLYVADMSQDARDQLMADCGYTATAQGLNMHLYYTPEAGFVKTQVNWEDDGDNDAVRPDKVVVSLFANGKATGRTAELNGANGWTATWDDLDSYYSDHNGVGQKVVYTVQVGAVDGYSVEYVPASTTTVEPETIYVNLSHLTETTTATAHILWNDGDDKDAVRPDEVMVQLYADGKPVVGRKVAVTAADGWTYTFDGLPVRNGGKEIYYTVQVDDNVAGYEDMSAGMAIYMGHEIATGDLYVSFRFDDNNDADGLRPDGGYLFLKADGVRVNEADYVHTTYSEADGTVKDYFYGLPVYSSGRTKIQYSVDVEWSDEHFGGQGDAYDVLVTHPITLSDGGQKADQLVITVRLKERKTVTQPGMVYWFDNNNQRGNRPHELTINVYDDNHSYRVGEYVLVADDGAVYKTDDLARENPVGTVEVDGWGWGEGSTGASVWKYSIEGLPANAVYDGESYKAMYYATAQATGLVPWYSKLDGRDNGMNINLTHQQYATDRPSAVQDFNVVVNWLDAANAWGYRPDALGVELELSYLSNDGWKTYKTVHLTRKNAMTDNPDAWTYTFEDVPTYLEGNGVKWRAQVATATGLDTWYRQETGLDATNYSVINMVQVVSFGLTARWNDFRDNDAVRPGSLEMGVYADGKLVGTATLAGDGDIYTGSVEQLPVYRTVGDGAAQYSFGWTDATAAALRDNDYTAAATRNGEAVEGPGWYWLSATTWGDRNDPGMSGEGRYSVETTLTRNKETIPVLSGTVRFDDAGDQDGKRPESVGVQLYGQVEGGDRFEVGGPVELRPEGGSELAEWPVSWEDLDVKLAGRKITYTMDVVGEYGDYAKAVSADGMSVTLSHEPETTTVTATLKFDDSSEAHYHYQYGVHTSTTYSVQRFPARFALLRDGKAYGDVYNNVTVADGEDAVVRTWTVPVYHDHGTVFAYDTAVAYDGTDLAGMGYASRHEATGDYETLDTVWHDLFGISGTVYRNYVGPEFLLGGTPVTAYVRDEATGTYRAVGSAVTGEDGTYEIRNCVRTGDEVIVRATFQYGDYSYAGSAPIDGRTVDRHDAAADVLVNRDAAIDADMYRYTASGRAYLQTDRKDDATRSAVPDGSIVLLYRLVDGKAEYAGMTQVKDGAYSFGGLESGSYVVNVVFEYDGGVYTYDNADAVADGLSFVISGADRQWADLVKQVNGKVDVKPVDPVPTEPDDPDEPEEKFVTGGHVFFNDRGNHTTDPVEDVDVYVYTESGNLQAGRAVTGADGAWSVEGLAEGSYVAVFSYKGNASRVLRFDVAASDLESGSLEVMTQYFDRVVSQPTAAIKGVVLDEDGNRVQAMVQVLDRDGNLVDFAYADENGLYAFTVAAGFTYTVRIQEVGVEYEAYAAGDPDDDATVLDYYVASGEAVVDGEARANETVAIYKQDADLDFGLLTWTLSDGEGRWSVRLQEAGNYEAVVQTRDGKSASHKFSVGYQEWEPKVYEQEDGTYAIRGSEAFDGLMLQNTTTGVVVREETGRDGTDYEFTGLSAGTYDLTLIKGLDEKHYYVDCPDDVVDVTWYMTVSGEAVRGGKPVLGAVARLVDAEGNQVGGDIIVTDGSYGWTNVPEGIYEVRVEYPVAGTSLGLMSTDMADSFGARYPDGMPEGSTWAWNLNGRTVTGTVTDQTWKNPIAGATVVARSKDNPSLAFAGTTGPDGMYTIGVLPGEYVIDAMFEVDVDHVYHARETRDDVVDHDSNLSHADLVIERHLLTGGVVRSGDDRPMEGVEVVLAYADGTEVAKTVTDGDGSFGFTVWPDEYVLSATHDGETASAAVSVDKATEAVLRVGDVIYLTGTVYDVDGGLVADGIVHYEGPTSGTAYTDDDGRFSIGLSAAELGRYSVYAEAAGNRSDRLDVEVATDTDVELALKDPRPSATLWTLAGVVTDDRGNRLADAVVTVRYGDDKAQVMTTSTDGNGLYRFQVEDGTYYLTAMYQGDNGQSYETNAETVAHVSGAPKTDANLLVRVGHEVTVAVVDMQGDPVEGAEVLWTGTANGFKTTDAAGTVSLWLAGGSYEFQALVGNRVSDVVRKDVSGSCAIELAIGPAGLAVNPPEAEADALAITGTVYGSDGEPHTGGARVVLSLLEGEDGDERYRVVDSTISDGDGHYEFIGLASGQYKVEVLFEEASTVASEVEYFDVTDYACDTDGNPFTGATVNLYNEEGDLVASTTTDGSGYYEFLYLAQGQYRVEVIPVNIDADGNRVEDPDGAMSWTVASASESSFVISGVAVDANGDPVEGAVVLVSDRTGEQASMTTDATGEYSFEMPAGEYTVSIRYPLTYEFNTDGYEPDGSDVNAPEVSGDGYAIDGVVLDTDGNAVDGAQVVLSGDAQGTAVTGPDGRYAFDGLRPGTYKVTVSWNGESVAYDIDADGNVSAPEEPDRPVRPGERIRLAGVVVTDHKKPLAGAVVTVTEQDSGRTFTLVADADGRFDTGELERGRYGLFAEYTHGKGSNASDVVTSVRTQEDLALAIVLSYVDDVNGDGKAELVFAGMDDAFDTPDDFYEADVAADGVADRVMAGADGKPGTADDWYAWSLPDGGDKVTVGPDRLAGTEDDRYLVKGDTVYIGKDGVPATSDDWYVADVDGDRETEQVFLGDDAKYDTADDWYLDKDGNKEFVTVWVRFDPNGGKVGDKTAEYGVKVSDVSELPVAAKDNNRFLGWFLPGGTTAVTLDAVKALSENAVLTAKWQANNNGGGSGGSGGGGGGGGSFGGGGSGGGSASVEITDPVTPLDTWSYRVAETLDLDNHIAYIRGSDDGLVHPTADITRAEVAMVFYRLLREEVRNQYKTGVSGFSDVKADSWYATAVATLARMGIVNGKGDGLFDPDAKITRAEFAAIAARFDKLDTGDVAFTDVPESHWAHTYIVSAATKGWILGTGDGLFQPGRNITRAEVMALVNRMLGRDTVTVDGMLEGMATWADNADASAWYYLDVQEATNAHEFDKKASHEVWTKLEDAAVSDR